MSTLSCLHSQTPSSVYGSIHIWRNSPSWADGYLLSPHDFSKILKIIDIERIGVLDVQDCFDCRIRNV